MDNVIDLVLYDDQISHYDYFSTILTLDDTSGEKKLIIGVLLYGVIDYFDTKQVLKEDAKEWIFGKQEDTWPYSFENICFALKLDAEKFRNDLKNMENDSNLPAIVKKLKRLNPTTGTRNKIR